MRVAIYARASTERQERQQTIDSQLEALRSWVASNGHMLDQAHVFRDDGYSGARLDRPGLDALRDIVRDGAVEGIAVLSPDRLARRYAYHVVLLEEFRRAGCEVLFLHHPISQDPNDQLLLQIQGAIAEYERAVLGERLSLSGRWCRDLGNSAEGGHPHFAPHVEAPAPHTIMRLGPRKGP